MQARRRLRIANKRKTSLADLEPGDTGGKAGRSSTGKKVVIACDLLLTFVPIRGPMGRIGRMGPISCDRSNRFDGMDGCIGPIGVMGLILIMGQNLSDRYPLVPHQ